MVAMAGNLSRRGSRGGLCLPPFHPLPWIAWPVAAPPS
jgi:hypothetical protein